MIRSAEGPRLASTVGVLSLLAVLWAAVGSEHARANTRLAAGGATVDFPVGTPMRGMGDPTVKHRHGEPWIMLFLGTFDEQEKIRDDDGETLIAALQGAELWSVGPAETQEAFWFATMALPVSLSARLWAKTCRPNAAPRFSCRAVTVGGAPGREYLLRAKDPTRPGVRPYLVQRIVVRGDRLYLLAYDGAEDAAEPEAKHPLSPRQKAFLNSLRFQGP